MQQARVDGRGGQWWRANLRALAAAGGDEAARGKHLIGRNHMRTRIRPTTRKRFRGIVHDKGYSTQHIQNSTNKCEK